MASEKISDHAHAQAEADAEQGGSEEGQVTGGVLDRDPGRGADEREPVEEVVDVIAADDQVPADVRGCLRRRLGRSGEEDEGPGQGKRGEQRDQDDEGRVLPWIRDLFLEDARKSLRRFPGTPPSPWRDPTRSKGLKATPGSPSNLLAVSVESPGRILREHYPEDDGSPSHRHAPRRTAATHVRADPPGTDRIDADSPRRKFPSQYPSEGIEGHLRDGIRGWPTRALGLSRFKGRKV